MTTFAKAHNGGRVHAFGDRYNRFGQLTLCGRVIAVESGRSYTASDVNCHACQRSLKKIG